MYRRRSLAGDFGGKLPNVLVSLTSYGDRLDGVDLTIRSLLAQRAQPGLIALYVADHDKDRLPRRLLDLQSERFEIRFVPDWRSYKKFIPALRWLASSDTGFDWLVVCDDDTIYPRDWLGAFRIDERTSSEAVSHRCHVVAYDKAGNFLPYKYWKMNVKSPPAHLDLFATGCGGIAFPVRSIDPWFYLTDDWSQLAPTCDDVWIYFMLKCSGITMRQSGFTFTPDEWTPRGSDKLWRINRETDEAGRTNNDLALDHCLARLRERGCDV